jgi:hypothetical protein
VTPAEASAGNNKANESAESAKLNATENESPKESSAKSGEQSSPTVKTEGAAAQTHASPKKRRKVNHGKKSCKAQFITTLWMIVSLIWLCHVNSMCLLSTFGESHRFPHLFSVCKSVAHFHSRIIRQVLLP